MARMLATAGAAVTGLWHYTCQHGRDRIGKRGELRPNAHPWLPLLGRVIWLTDDPTPTRDAVGLTSTTLTCDRMQYRYRVTETDAVPWAQYRPAMPSDIVDDLERYGEPDTWHVARWARVVLS
jgi:hypothetical protein